MATLDSKERNQLAKKDFAFTAQEKMPLEDASHIRNAIARFNQVKQVTDLERDAAWRRILTAAKRFGVEVEEKTWHDLNRRPAGN